jgi:hypothetical protein
MAQAGNFLTALARHVASGMVRASAQEQSRRLALCQACFFLVQDRCGKCGCPVKAKAAWQEQRCPLGKW